MENEILWKWELLCDEFEQAKRNYTNVFSAVLQTVATGANNQAGSMNLAQLKQAEAAWHNWVEIQDQIKKFVEENT